MRFPIDLEPRERWDLRIDVVASLSGEESPPTAVEQRFGHEREHVRDSLAAWRLNVPKLRTSRDSLYHAFDQSVADLAALRMRSGDSVGRLPAAGMPWFMTVFGRDTIITSLQSMLLGPELALAALDALAELQASEEDPTIDAEPGKIIHELRRGRAAETWFASYYGTVDATPLYLVLLSEVWRWTGDAGPVERLEGLGARRARVDRPLRRPRRRRLRRVRATHRAWAREPVLEGLRRLAALPRRDVRVDADRAGRGAGLRLRREGPPGRARARGLGRRAARAEARARGGGARRSASTPRTGSRSVAATPSRSTATSGRSTRSARTSATCSGAGSSRPSASRRPPTASWASRSGRAGASARCRPATPRTTRSATTTAPSGRTTRRSVRGASRAPAAGRTRGGSRETLIDAARWFDWSLPEVFAGYGRDETPFPIAYPTAARPQAWAAGTPVLLLRLLLGLEPDVASRTLTSVCPKPLPGVGGPAHADRRARVRPLVGRAGAGRRYRGTRGLSPSL